MHKKSGFTLIELMIAVIVIGILATIAVPNYARSMERAKCSQAVHIIKDMRTAALSFYAENELFPSLMAELEDEVGANFYSGGTNPDWTFAIAGGAQVLVLTATRLSGPNFAAGNTTIILTDDPATNKNEEWTGSYPIADPGGW